jgi:hypothetical protein
MIRLVIQPVIHHAIPPVRDRAGLRGPVPYLKTFALYGAAG